MRQHLTMLRLSAGRLCMCVLQRIGCPASGWSCSLLQCMTLPLQPTEGPEPAPAPAQQGPDSG